MSEQEKWRKKGSAIYIGHKYLASAASELHADEIVTTVNTLFTCRDQSHAGGPDEWPIEKILAHLRCGLSDVAYPLPDGPTNRGHLRGN